MKKILACLIVVTLLVACAFSTSAAGITADEKKIIDALSEEIKMASGKIVALPDKYVNQAEDYLTKADLTDQQITDILGHIDSAKTVVEASSADSLSAAEVAVKNKVIEEAEKAAEVVDATISVKKVSGETQGQVTANYEVTLKFDSNSTVPGYTEGTTIVISSSSNEIMQTGAEGNVTMTVVASVVLLAAVAFVVVASRKKVTSK